MTAKVELGSISTGTLRDEDLLPAFVAELERVGEPGKHVELILRAAKVIKRGFAVGFDWSRVNDADNASFGLADDLTDALNEYAPPHTYFGTLEGDGADFGFWPTGEDFSDTCNVEVVSSGPNGEGELIDLDCKLWVVVNDHGNVTVSTVGPREEIWSVV